jgi:hypothetical protein
VLCDLTTTVTSYCSQLPRTLLRTHINRVCCPSRWTRPNLCQKSYALSARPRVLLVLLSTSKSAANTHSRPPQSATSTPQAWLPLNARLSIRRPQPSPFLLTFRASGFHVVKLYLSKSGFACCYPPLFDDALVLHGRGLTSTRIFLSCSNALIKSTPDLATTYMCSST